MTQQLECGKRVAVLVQGNEEYGVGQVAINLATELKRRGEEPSIVALEHGALTERAIANGIACHVLDITPLPQYVKSKWKTILAVIRQQFWLRHAAQMLARWLGEHSSDLLVVQWPAHVALAGKSAQIAGIPCYWMMPNAIHNSWPLGLNRKFYRHLCRRFQLVPLPNSRYTGNTLGDGVGAQTLYLGVDESRFQPKPANAFTRLQLGLPKDACVAGIFARIDPTKGHAPLWQAMCNLIELGHDLHLLVIGGPADGPVARELRELAVERNAVSRLHFVGWTNEPERYYDAIDFAVNTRVDPEPFGLSVIEAMLTSRPVLVHALGGPAETVVNGVTGWHVPAATADAIAAGLQRAWRDRGRWIEMGEAARLHALENFSVSAFVTGFLRIVSQETPPSGTLP